jgi:thiosulfate reductase cytochrome b subunit
MQQVKNFFVVLLEELVNLLRKKITHLHYTNQFQIKPTLNIIFWFIINIIAPVNFVAGLLYNYPKFLNFIPKFSELQVLNISSSVSEIDFMKILVTHCADLRQ